MPWGQQSKNHRLLTSLLKEKKKITLSHNEVKSTVTERLLLVQVLILHPKLGKEAVNPPLFSCLDFLLYYSFLNPWCWMLIVNM